MTRQRPQQIAAQGGLDLFGIGFRNIPQRVLMYPAQGVGLGASFGAAGQRAAQDRFGYAVFRPVNHHAEWVAAAFRRGFVKFHRHAFRHYSARVMTEV
jgi:hypothetical protein